MPSTQVQIGTYLSIFYLDTAVSAVRWEDEVFELRIKNKTRAGLSTLVFREWLLFQCPFLFLYNSYYYK